MQFDVTMARLKAEYGVEADYEPVNYMTARWVTCDDRKILEEFEKANRNDLAMDGEGNLAFLAEGNWQLRLVAEKWPRIVFHTTRELR